MVDIEPDVCRELGDVARVLIRYPDLVLALREAARGIQDLLILPIGGIAREILRCAAIEADTVDALRVNPRQPPLDVSRT